MEKENSIGTRIRILRRQRGLSQATLAEYIGISSKHLSKIELNEVSFSISILIKLSAFFRVSNDYILTGKDFEVTSEQLLYLLQHIRQNESKGI
ncbi:MAG: helix-turn-helix transcriptional regulator [Lachnospiraceae bacterium]|nr:helix-turn-helix transcriptional regulator [Lachnospiraceae bacterium]MDD6448708.1 helix-turn-helix transcriptional regulator [Lachnospiraceae bacterium]MDD6451917.1 helix-turn-helix transcriptional regulator [Lachnospiraceae bacterium]MDD6578631.1 helix-turn-helix transcriptional regulator [Lachnospiraceae bacterium]